MLLWSHTLCVKHMTSIEKGEELKAAAAALITYMDIMRDNPADMNADACEKLMHSCLRTLDMMNRAECGFTPKCHLWLHLTQRVPLCGNPRLYSTFLDESLNHVVSCIAGAANRRTWEKRIFQRIGLLPYVQNDSYWAKTQ